MWGLVDFFVIFLQQMGPLLVGGAVIKQTFLVISFLGVNDILIESFVRCADESPHLSASWQSGEYMHAQTLVMHRPLQTRLLNLDELIKKHTHTHTHACAHTRNLQFKRCFFSPLASRDQSFDGLHIAPSTS